MLNYHVYVGAPIDWWEEEGWQPLSRVLVVFPEEVANGIIAVLMIESFNHPKYWEGDIACGPFAKHTPVGFAVAWKQSNNGSTFLVSFDDINNHFPSDVALFYGLDHAEQA